MNHNRRRLFKTWEILCLALLTLAASAGMGAVAVWIDLASAEDTFKQRADSIQRDLAHRFGSTEAVLTALVGLHHASDDLRADEFAALSRELLAAYPFIRTVALGRRIAAEERLRFERDMSADGFLKFQITEREAGGRLARAGDRQVMMPIIQLEPREPEVTPLIGFDIASLPVLKHTMDRAIESGEVLASDPVELPHIGRGIVVFKAIYLGHSSPRSQLARRSQVSGVAALFLEPNLFLRRFAEMNEEFGIRLATATDDGRFATSIFDRPTPAANGMSRLFEPFSVVMPIKAQGRSFLLEVKSQRNLGTVSL